MYNNIMNKQIPSFETWREAQRQIPGAWTSFDRYKEQFGLKEYQCFYLDPRYKLAHADDAEVLFESDRLDECCVFVYELFKKEGRDVAVWHERSSGYREIYRKPARNSKGQFVTR